MSDSHTSPNVPPDPEGKNQERAEWAAVAVEGFAQQTGQLGMGETHPALSDSNGVDWWQETIQDLLCNLHHLADRTGVNFRDVARWAESSYDEETGH